MVAIPEHYWKSPSRLLQNQSPSQKKGRRQARRQREARTQVAILQNDALNEEIKRRGPKLANGIYYHEVEVRIRARLFLALGKEGQRRFKQKHPKVEIHSTTFRDFSKLLKDLFEAEVNVTYERIILFTRNQKKGESLERWPVCSQDDEWHGTPEEIHSWENHTRGSFKTNWSPRKGGSNANDLPTNELKLLN